VSRVSRAEREEQARLARKEAEAEPKEKPKFTVVVELSPVDAQHPNVPTMAYVLPTGNLSATTFEQFREAAAKGGCQVRMFTVEASGVEAVKWELMNYGATRLM
jgi:hypothetical protein